MDLEHFAAVMAGLSLVITVVTQLGFAPWQDTRGIVGASDFDKLLGRFLAEPKAAEVWPDQVLKSPCRPAVGALSFGITERRALVPPCCVLMATSIKRKEAQRRRRLAC